MEFEELTLMRMHFIEDLKTYVGVFTLGLSHNPDLDVSPDERLHEHGEIVVYVRGETTETVSDVQDRLFAALKGSLARAQKALEPLDFAASQRLTAERKKNADSAFEESLAASIAIS